MNITIIFLIMIALIGLTGIPAAICDKLDCVKHQRMADKKKFVKNHPKYGIDAKGRVVKL